MPARPLVPRLVLALTLALAGCSGARTSPADGRGALEGELARLPRGGGPDATVRRARVLCALGRQPEALTEIEAAADAARERLDWRGLTELWRASGGVYLELGRPQDALEAFGKRLKTAAALEEQAARAVALVDTAYALSLMGSMSRADEALSEAQLLAADAVAADPLALERAALTAERLSEPDRAAESLARARQGFERAGDAAGAARTAVYLAALKARAAKSSAPLDAIEAVADATPDPEPRARLRRFQAEAALDAKRFGKCEEVAAEAVALADKRGLAPVAKLARVALARCAAESGHLDRAIGAAEEAGMLAEEQREHLTGEQARQEAGFEAFQIHRLLLSLQVKLPEKTRAAQAFVTMERARARAHLDAVARGRLSTSPAEVSPLLLRNKEEAEEHVRRLTQELTARRGEAGLAERHRDALWALEDVKEAIRQSNPLLARIQVPEPATPAAVREAMLDKDTLLLSYFMAEEQAILVAVDQDGEALAILRPTPEDLSKAVRGFRRGALVAPNQELGAVKEGGARLYRELLGPVEARVASHKKLVIIPHGPLASLPFEALVDASGKFVVETHDVSYGLSATLGVELARDKPGNAARKGFVGMGDPVYDWAAFKGGQKEGSSPAASRALTLWVDAVQVAEGEGKKQAPGLERLPGTAAELRAISKLFGADQRLYLREQATEENVKAGALSGYRIVHIASHGLLEPHYQALALTLDPGAKEDGFLLNSEIVDLHLDADLVVLSACQTGNTRQRSAEPIAGLALALRAAGARRLVVSLWSVDDDATARLMGDFYRPLVKEGASYAQALSEAKRQMIAKGPAHPFFWAPFILLGN